MQRYLQRPGYQCLFTFRYKFGCRQVAVDDNTGTVKIFNANAEDLKRVTFLSRSNAMIGIVRIK